MRRRIARWTAVACGALVAGGGLGFLARDILELGQPAVAVAWLLAAAAAVGVELRVSGRPPGESRGRGSPSQEGGDGVS
jgi:hypothetical protein